MSIPHISDPFSLLMHRAGLRRPLVAASCYLLFEDIPRLLGAPFGVGGFADVVPYQLLNRLASAAIICSPN